MKGLRNFLTTFLVFFVLVAFVITCCIVLFVNLMQDDMNVVLTNEHLELAAKMTFVNVLFLSLMFASVDSIRRKVDVERPVKQILKATDQLTKGDLSVRIPEPTHRDMYGFDRIIRDFNRMAEELGSVETLRTDFIANVSHEMKTPLAVMRNYAKLLQTPDLTQEQRLTYARAIDRSSQRLSDLMTNILKLNRLENQQIYPQPREYDLSEQLCRCLLQFESRWEEDRIEIEADIAEGVTIRMDEELLELVWNNLLSNAFKFTEPGGRVGLRLAVEKGAAVVTVSDTGCGMTPEVGAHIFEKFYQGDTSHATAGNGLGLPLVKRIIDITGSEIAVSSAPGVGSTFTVRLGGVV